MRAKHLTVDMNTLPSHLAEMSIHYNRERRAAYPPHTSTNDFVVKGKKQELHAPQVIRAIRGQGSDDGTRSQRDIETQATVSGKEMVLHDADDRHGDDHPSGDAVNSRKAIVCSRSQSNNLLNVMSIDDCKMGLRYRPQRVINSHETEQDNYSNMAENNGDEEGPLRISQGSGVTPVSQTRIHSMLSAQRLKHKQYVLTGNCAGQQRPQSAILARAFDTILQDKSLITNNKEARFLLHYKEPVHSKGKHLYHRLNNTLKKQMNHVINARWDTMRSKDGTSTRVQYNGSDSRFSKRSTVTDSLVSDDAKRV